MRHWKAENEQLKARIKELERHNEELRTFAAEVMKQYKSLTEPVRPPKYYITSEKYLQMLDYLIDRTISTNNPSSASLLAALSGMKKTAETEPGPPISI